MMLNEDGGEAYCPLPQCGSPTRRDNWTMLNDDVEETQSFAKVFSPLAHHLFPDGCPDNDLSSVWPVRANRNVVPSSQAKGALSALKRWAQEAGLEADEMNAVVACSCYVVSDRCTSPLASQFQDFLRCLIPSDSSSRLTDDSVEKLILAKLDNAQRSSVYQFLMLSLQNHVAVTLEQVLPFYPVILHHCRTTDEAIQVALSTTRRHHVQVYRAQRLRSWYNEGRTMIHYLLELYGEMDPHKCRQYVPRTDPPQLTIRHQDSRWENNLRRFTSTRTPTDKRPRIAFYCDHDSPPTSLTDPNLLFQVATSNYRKTLTLRNNLPYLLYEKWFAVQHFEAGEIHENDPHQDGEAQTDKQSRTMISHKSRMDLVQSLAVFTNHVGKLMPEMEQFVVKTVLPSWDGTESLGFHLCHDVLPYLENHDLVHSFVLPRLQPLVRFGSPRIQYRLLGVLVPQLIRFWGDSAHTILLVQWASSEFKRIQLLQNHELVRLAVVEFYEGVRQVTSHLPNASAVSLLLFSPTVVSIDQLCALLLRYRTMLFNERAGRSPAAAGRIKVYNGYIWDICCILWRGSLTDARDLVKFSDDEENNVGSILHKRPDALSLTKSATFAGYCTPGHRGKLIDHLDKDCGLSGLTQFLTTFVGALAERARRRRDSHSTIE